eukprot:jgi/Astpho2/5254/Aster-04826
MSGIRIPHDPILGVTEAFLADKNPEKINLGVGAYRDDNGKPVVLNCVREAERRVCGHNFMEYLPMGGLKDFNQVSIKLAYGDNSPAIAEGRVAAVQSLSGTGSCRLMAEFMKRYKPGAKIWITSPTWSNHHNIFRDAGVERKEYRYYKDETRGLDLDGLLEDLKGANSGDVVLLHACAHNPTGVDPTPEQWKQISQVMKDKQLYPFFDMAYQGFASGDCERDGQAIRIFQDDGHEMACSQSYAKNMGLYGQRIGCFSLIAADQKEAQAAESQVKEVKGMAGRIIDMRTLLREKLEGLGSKMPWKHITDQIGMFAYSGMTGEQVDKLADDFSIYMTRNGRISMAGVNSHNVERLAKAMHEVTG